MKKRKKNLRARYAFKKGHTCTLSESADIAAVPKLNLIGLETALALCWHSLYRTPKLHNEVNNKLIIKSHLFLNLSAILFNH